MNLVVVFIFVLASGVAPMWTWLLLPLLLAALFVFTTAVSMIVASLYPRFRDLGIIWAVAGDDAVLRHAGALPARIVSDELRQVIG